MPSLLGSQHLHLEQSLKYLRIGTKQLIEKHNGKVPNNFEDLHDLPGVGRKTASVVLNEGFGLPTIAVDTHVFRVSNRTGLAPGKNPDEVQKNCTK